MDVLHGDAHLDHQHHGMVGKVGKLVDGLGLVVGLAGDDDLGALLAHLFEDLVDAFLEEVGGVGAFGALLIAAHQHVVQTVQAELVAVIALPDFLGEAGIGAQMAGRTFLFHHDHQCVVVAVGGDGDDVLVIAAGLALEPQLLTGTAPEAGQTLLHGNGKTFTVHVRQGQDLLGDSVHHDGGDQTLFVKFQFVNVQHIKPSQ